MKNIFESKKHTNLFNKELGHWTFISKTLKRRKGESSFKEYERKRKMSLENAKNST